MLSVKLLFASGIILVSMIYIAFGFFSYYYAITTKQESLKNASLITKITYYHGYVFIGLFIFFGVISWLSGLVYMLS